MEKNKRKPATAAKSTQYPLHAPVPSHTNQGGSLVLGLQLALGTLSSAISHMPAIDLPPSPVVFSSNGVGTSTVREAIGSPVAKSSQPLAGFVVEDCSDDEYLEEEQVDFIFFEEEDETSPPSSLAPVTPEIPVSPKGANFNLSNNVKAEARTVEKAGSASAKKNVKGSVFTRLSPSVDDSLVDASPAVAPLVEAHKLAALIVPTEACVTQDEQQCSQPTAVGSEEWQIV
ncbi:hypothetical protein Peur_032139 [Populus x canadensis]